MRGRFLIVFGLLIACLQLNAQEVISTDFSDWNDDTLLGTVENGVAKTSGGIDFVSYGVTGIAAEQLYFKTTIGSDNGQTYGDNAHVAPTEENSVVALEWPVDPARTITEVRFMAETKNAGKWVYVELQGFNGNSWQRVNFTSSSHDGQNPINGIMRDGTTGQGWRAAAAENLTLTGISKLRLRAWSDPSATSGEYGILIDDLSYTLSTEGLSQVLDEVTTTQVTDAVEAGKLDQPVIAVEINAVGDQQSYSLTGLNLGLTGIDLTDKLKIYSTGSSATFETTTLIHEVAAPAGNTLEITAFDNGAVVLADGKNYFWAVVDIKASAPQSAVIDISCTQTTVNNGAEESVVPTVTNPDGAITITSEFCASFDGVDDYAAFANTGALDRQEVNGVVGGFTIETWIRTKDTDGTILSNYKESVEDKGGFEFALTGGKMVLRMKFDTGSGQKGTSDAVGTVSDGEWHHIAVVVEEGDVNFYQDGEFVHKWSKSWANAPWTADSEARIGSQTNETGITKGFLGARLANLRVWQVARTAEEIKGSMNLHTNSNANGLKVFFPMLKGSGNVLTDYAGGNDTTEFTGTWGGCSAPISGIPENMHSGDTGLSNGAMAVAGAESEANGGFELRDSANNLFSTDTIIFGQTNDSMSYTDTFAPNGYIRLERTWYVSSKVGAKALDVIFHTDDIDPFLGVNSDDPTDLKLLYRDGTGNEFVELASSADEIRFYQQAVFEQVTINSGYYTLASVGVPLTPALDMTVEQSNGLLSWQVDESANVSEFQVEAKVDGEWTVIAEIDADGSGSYHYEILNDYKDLKVTVLDSYGSKQSFFAARDNKEVIELDVKAGWNLLALPGEVDNFKELFCLNGTVWGWNGQAYVKSENITAGNGFWYFSNSAKTLEVSYTASTVGVTLEKGWNLKGISENSIVPDNTVIFTWGKSYEQVLDKEQIMLKGKGYWIYSENEENFTF